ncbi:MAG: tetratricopeptide repeat protein [Proteobacteria bacterium]|nr:tetratricopeptide repeat protein [Pseudomonadota bacterium]
MPQQASAKQNLRTVFDKISGLFQAGRLREADQAAENVLAEHPGNVNFLHLAGLIKQNLGDHALAEKLLSSAHALRPEQGDILHNLAVFYVSRGRMAEAQPLYARLVEIAPTQAPLWATYGHILRNEGHLRAALEAFEKAQSLKPDAGLEGAIAVTQRQLALWDVPPLAPGKITAALAPIFVEDPAQHLAIVRRASEQVKPVSRYEAKPKKEDRLRIGYLSCDFHEHATSHLIAELFALHDRANFEVFVYSYGPQDDAPIRARLKQGAEHWMECGGPPPAAVAERIFRDRIQVLVDLKGYTRGGMPEVLAARPAPVIMEWLGYPGSMGADFVDYTIADATLVPPELRAQYPEKIVFMPGSYQINDRQRPVADVKTRAEYGLPEEAFVLCCFNQVYKITPQIFSVWMSVMCNDAQTVLWLFATHEEAVSQLQAEAKARAVDPARLIFAPKLPQAEHLARYRAADLVLDTSPYGGHTTTSDALWAGAPVVALQGQSFAARVSASLLKAAGLPDFVTPSLSVYEAKIREILARPQSLEPARKRLQNRTELLLFNTHQFVKNLENAYTRAYGFYEKSQEFSDIRFE